MLRWVQKLEASIFSLPGLNISPLEAVVDELFPLHHHRSLSSGTDCVEPPLGEVFGGAAGRAALLEIVHLLLSHGANALDFCTRVATSLEEQQGRGNESARIALGCALECAGLACLTLSGDAGAMEVLPADDDLWSEIDVDDVESSFEETRLMEFEAEGSRESARAAEAKAADMAALEALAAASARPTLEAKDSESGEEDEDEGFEEESSDQDEGQERTEQEDEDGEEFEQATEDACALLASLV
jgi:hypothetical protein